jgi:hypothetical protein
MGSGGVGEVMVGREIKDELAASKSPASSAYRKTRGSFKLHHFTEKMVEDLLHVSISSPRWHEGL